MPGADALIAEDTPHAASDLALPFDRELDQYRIAADSLADQVRTLQTKLDECRDGGDLLEDYRRYYSQFQQVQRQQKDLAGARSRYITDRDRLAAWGSTEGWVVAGSIVTVRYPDGHQGTFVLTDRGTDTEHPTVAYSSALGQAVRRKKVGDEALLPDEGILRIERIVPGFRAPATSGGEGQPPSAPAISTTTRAVPDAATASQALSRQRCRDKTYRDDLYQRRYAPSVRAINEYVDELRAARHVSIPYVAPSYGGVNARLLTLMQDPGPKTDLANVEGSGMICLENVDLSAARQKFFLNEAGIDVSEIVSWNAYPWRKPHPQTCQSDREAAEALRRFLLLTPYLEVVILNGTVAKRIWGVLEKIDSARTRRIMPFPTFHTSERAVNPDKRTAEYIAAVNHDLSSKYAAAARRLY
ncbi:hypothetical protein [Prescottella equi]|uniref:hypothetical protein n=1 Tax=Rhodococcus hoagii TaxID=43767 RepID=UPI0015856A7C|nr:hypothetical protein [Prescottella equi]